MSEVVNPSEGSERNCHGLSRKVPAEVRREIRRRSRFGCVKCRCGFYELEHIDPIFADARTHDPGRMCCLCASCHDNVTRGRCSKAAIQKAYADIQRTSPESVKPPRGPLDFHNENAELAIGGISYRPAVQTVLRYHGTDLIRVTPGTKPGERGSISAVFTDDSGEETLRLDDNEWIGSLKPWDIEVEGRLICVRKKRGVIALQLRLEPPGRLAVERLDMRFRDAHVLATESTYAIGRLGSMGQIYWVYLEFSLNGSDADGAAIEFAAPEELARRIRAAGGGRPEEPPPEFAAIGGEGAMHVRSGICLGSRCYLTMRHWMAGVRPLKGMRRAVLAGPQAVREFLGAEPA